MAAARYWRLSGVRPWGLGALAISEVALYTSAGRADGAATLTARIPPASGDISALQDGSASAVVAWSAAQVAAPGWALVWDFGTAVDIASMAVGSGQDKAGYPCDARLDSSSDGVSWTVLGEANGMLWPGPYTLGSVDNLRSHVFALNFNGGTVSDVFGHAVTMYGAAQIASATPLLDGTPYLSLAGGNDYLEVANTADLDFGTEYEIGFDLYVPAGAGVAGGAVWHQGFYNTSGTWTSPGLSIRLLDDYLRFYFWATTNANEQYLDVTYTANTAQRWRMTRLGTTGFVYRDGVQVATKTGLNTLPAPTRPLQIGRWTFSAGTPTMTARIDNLYADKGFQIATVGTQRVMPTRGSGMRIAAASAVPAFQSRAVRKALLRDMEFGGSGTVFGTTKIKGATNVPTKARVVLMHGRSKQPVRETWSDPVTGYFAFPGIDTRQQFIAYAEDAEGSFRPVAANRLDPKVI